WHLPLAWRATSSPVTPGICMSRKTISGDFASSACSALMPSSASAQMSSSGQIDISVSLSSASSNGSSSAIRALGALTGDLHRCLGALCFPLAQLQARRVAIQYGDALADLLDAFVAQPGHESGAAVGDDKSQFAAFDRRADGNRAASL